MTKTALALFTPGGLAALHELGFDTTVPHVSPAVVVGAHPWWNGSPDDRVPEFVATIGRLVPEFFILESVRGLAAPSHRDYFEARLSELEVIGYHVESKVLDAIDYGGGAERKRLFILGQRLDIVELRGAKHAIHWPRRMRPSYHAWATGADIMKPVYKALLAPNVR